MRRLNDPIAWAKPGPDLNIADVYDLLGQLSGQLLPRRMRVLRLNTLLDQLKRGSAAHAVFTDNVSEIALFE